MSNETETYHKLLTAAAACFAEKGFSATSIREISTRAGISQGAMYTYFKGKDALIAAIVLEEQKTALDLQDRAYEGAHFVQLVDIVQQCISDVGYPVTHNLWVEIIAESARNPALREIFIASDRIMRSGLAKIIQKGIDAGEFSATLDIEETTIIIFAFIDGLIGRKAMHPDFSLEKDLTSFKNLMRKIVS